MVETHPELVPRDNDIIFGVNLQALHPDAHLLKACLVLKPDADVTTLLIDLSCQEGSILAPIVEVEDEHTIDSCSDKPIIFIVEVCEVYKPD